MSDPFEVVLTRDGTNEADWLDARRTGISGSDALAAMGLDPRKQRAALWFEKVNGDEIEDNEPMAMGRILEDAVKRGFEWRTAQDRHPLTVVDNDDLLRSTEWPFLLATPDGYLTEDGEVGIFEAKTTTVWLEDEWADDQVPMRAAAQTMVYLAVTGLKFAYVAVLINNRILYRRIERDEALIAEIVDRLGAFWSCVTERRQPPIEFDAPDTADLVKTMWPTEAEGKLRELSQSHLELFHEWRDAVTVAAAAEKRRKALAAQLAAIAEDAELLTHGGTPIGSFRAHDRSSIDVKRLQEERPDVAAEFTKTTPVRVMRPINKKAS